MLHLVDSFDALRAGLAAVLDSRASNIGDPWPTVVAAGKLLRSPHAPLYSTFSIDGSSFIYPPLAAVLMLPFARLTYEQAHVALSILSRAAYLGCVVLVGTIAATAGARRAAAVACAAFVAVAFYPLLRAVQLNQSTLLVALCVGGAVLLALKGRPALSGLLLGVTAAFKPQMVLVVALLFWMSPRLTLAGLASAGLAGLASLASVGVADHVDYVTRVLPRLSTGYAFYPNQCWTGAVLRAAGEPFLAFALPAPSTGERIACLALNVATLLGAAIALRFASRGAARGSRDALVLALGFAWVMVTLASPISWEHHYTPAMFLFAFLLARPRLLGGVARASVAASFPLIAAYLDVRGLSGALGRLVSSYMVVGALLLASGLAHGLLAAPPPAPR